MNFRIFRCSVRARITRSAERVAHCMDPEMLIPRISVEKALRISNEKFGSPLNEVFHALYYSERERKLGGSPPDVSKKGPCWNLWFSVLEYGEDRPGITQIPAESITLSDIDGEAHRTEHEEARESSRSVTKPKFPMLEALNIAAEKFGMPIRELKTAQFISATQIECACKERESMGDNNPHHYGPKWKREGPHWTFYFSVRPNPHSTSFRAECIIVFDDDGEAYTHEELEAPPQPPPT